MTFWAFLGLESACANAESVENPEKNVPKAVICATLLTAFIYIATTNLTAGLVPNAVILQSDAPFAVVYATLFGGTSGAVVSCLLCWDAPDLSFPGSSPCTRFRVIRSCRLFPVDLRPNE
mgnify:CR=1 FL=1